MIEKIRKNLNDAYFIRDLQRLTLIYLLLGFVWYVLIDPFVWNFMVFVFIPSILVYGFTVQRLKKLGREDLDFFRVFSNEREGGEGK